MVVGPSSEVNSFARRFPAALFIFYIERKNYTPIPISEKRAEPSSDDSSKPYSVRAAF